MLTHPKQGRSEKQQVPQGEQKAGAGSQERFPQNPRNQARMQPLELEKDMQLELSERGKGEN